MRKRYYLQGVLFGCFLWTSVAQGQQALPDIPQLTLSSQGIVKKPADQLNLTIGVVTTGKQAEEAATENHKKMQTLVAALNKAGLDATEYRTGQFFVQPLYEYGENSGNRKPAISGYEANASLILKTTKLALAGKIIAEATKAGANQINDIHFDLQNPRAYWKEAAQKAMQQAREDAQTIAEAAGVKLDKILSISLNTPQFVAPRAYAFAKETLATGEPPIEAGEIAVTADISLAYQISPK